MTPFCLKVTSPKQEQNWNTVKSQQGNFDKFPSWCLFLEQEQIYRPKRETIEHHFHRETAVLIILDNNACCALRSTGTGTND